MSATDVDFIQRISHRLERFNWVNSGKAIFRCPICGDSRKDPTKVRGAFICEGDTWFFSCFNGCDTRSFGNFLRVFDEQLYKEYRVARFSGRKSQSSFSFNVSKPKKQLEFSQTAFESKSVFTPLQLVSSLKDDHKAKRYLRGRKIPSSFFDRCYYVDNYSQFMETIEPEPSKNTSAGIIIPLISAFGDEFGFQCRFFTGKMRYMTTMLDKNEIKCFGMDKVDFGQDINVFEGIFDSLYVKNSVAALDSSLDGLVTKLVARNPKLTKEKFVLWFDEDSYNPQVMKKKVDAAKAGFRIAFVPRELVTGKDINKIIQNSSTPKHTLQRIWNETKVLSGVRAVSEIMLNSKRGAN